MLLCEAYWIDISGEIDASPQPHTYIMSATCLVRRIVIYLSKKEKNRVDLRTDRTDK